MFRGAKLVDMAAAIAAWVVMLWEGDLSRSGQSNDVQWPGANLRDSCGMFRDPAATDSRRRWGYALIEKVDGVGSSP